MDPLLSTFLTRLVLRAFGEADGIQPLFASLFGWESWSTGFSENGDAVGLSERGDENGRQFSHSEINSSRRLNLNTQRFTSFFSNSTSESNLNSSLIGDPNSSDTNHISQDSYNSISDDFSIGIVDRSQDSENSRSSNLLPVSSNLPTSSEEFGISAIEASIEPDFPTIIPPQHLIRSTPTSSSSTSGQQNHHDRSLQTFSQASPESSPQRSRNDSLVNPPQSDRSNPEESTSFPHPDLDSSLESSATPPSSYHPSASSESSIEPSQETSIVSPNAFNPPSLEPRITPDLTPPTPQDFGLTVTDSVVIHDSIDPSSTSPDEKRSNPIDTEPTISTDRATPNSIIPQISASSFPSESIIQRKAIDSASSAASSPITSDFSSSTPTIEPAHLGQDNISEKISNHRNDAELLALDATDTAPTEIPRSLSQRLIAATDEIIQPAIGVEFDNLASNPEQAFPDPDSQRLSSQHPISHAPRKSQQSSSIANQNLTPAASTPSSSTTSQSSNLATSPNQQENLTETQPKEIDHNSQSLQIHGGLGASSEQLQSLGQIQPNIPTIDPTFESAKSPIAPINESLPRESLSENPQSFESSKSPIAPINESLPSESFSENPQSIKNSHSSLPINSPSQVSSPSNLAQDQVAIDSPSFHTFPPSQSIQPIVPGSIEFLERSPWDLDSAVTSEPRSQDLPSHSSQTSTSQPHHSQTHLTPPAPASELSLSSPSTEIQRKIERTSSPVNPNSSTFNHNQPTSSSFLSTSSSNPDRAATSFPIEAVSHSQQSPQISHLSQSIQPPISNIYHSSESLRSDSTQDINPRISSSIKPTSRPEFSIDLSSASQRTPLNHPDSPQVSNTVFSQETSSHLTQRLVSHPNPSTRQQKASIQPSYTSFPDNFYRPNQSNQALSESQQKGLSKARSESTIAPLSRPFGGPAALQPIPIPAAKPEPTSIEITIGKIEVRGISKTATPNSRSQSQSQRPQISLDQYLQHRNEEAR